MGFTFNLTLDLIQTPLTSHLHFFELWFDTSVSYTPIGMAFQSHLITGSRFWQYIPLSTLPSFTMPFLSGCSHEPRHLSERFQCPFFFFFFFALLAGSHCCNAMTSILKWTSILKPLSSTRTSDWDLILTGTGQIYDTVKYKKKGHAACSSLGGVAITEMVSSL